MLLRNYDNFRSFTALNNLNGYLDNSGYGDGFLSVRNWNKGVVSNYNPYGYHPFQYFYGTYGNNFTTSSGSTAISVLICGYDENEVTYDDCSIATVPTLNFVSHSFGSIVYDETSNTYTREYIKTFNNASSNPVTINCVGVTYSMGGNNNNNNYIILIYKEKLPQEIEIPAGASITLKFKTTVTGNPNKPMEASVSVE